MPWDNARPGTDPKYRTPEHRRERARRLAILKRDGQGVCAQPVCVMPTRLITYGMPLHLGHDDTGQHYIGLVHAKCNVKAGAVEGNRRSRGGSQPQPPRSRDW